MAFCPSCGKKLKDTIYLKGKERCESCGSIVKENPVHAIIWTLVMFSTGFIAIFITNSFIWTGVIVLGLLPLYFLTKTFVVDNSYK